jgi:hypothetical protein
MRDIPEWLVFDCADIYATVAMTSAISDASSKDSVLGKSILPETCSMTSRLSGGTMKACASTIVALPKELTVR